MHSFTGILVALSMLVALAFAGNNQITYPSAGDVIVAGSTTTLSWAPSSTDPVTLVLAEAPPDKQPPEALGIIETIASECTVNTSRVVPGP